METADTPIRYLPEARSWELLKTETVGRLAVSIHRNPDIFPVNFVVHAGRIIIRTSPGLKLAGAVHGRSVAFEVDSINHSTHTAWSVVVRGIASEPQKLEEYLELEDLDMKPWADGPKDRYIVISPRSISGRVLPPATTPTRLQAPDEGPAIFVDTP